MFYGHLIKSDKYLLPQGINEFIIFSNEQIKSKSRFNRVKNPH